MTDRAPIASRIAAAKSMGPSASPPPAPSSSSSPSRSATQSPANDSSSSATEGSPEASTTSGDASTSSGTSDSSAGSSSGDGSSDASGSDNASTDDGATYADDRARLDAIALALESGDLRAVVKATGRDVKLKDATAKAFTALSKREEKHRKRVEADNREIAKAKQEIATESHRASQILRHAETEYGWAARTGKAWDSRDMVTVAKGIERLCRGASLAQITQAIANMQMGKAEPKSAAEADLEEARAALARDKAAHEKQKQDERAAAEKQKSQATETEKRAAAVTKFGENWKAHPFLKNPDDPNEPDPEQLEQAFAAFETAWKADRSVKPKKVLDELWAAEQRRLKRLGITPTQAPHAAPAPKAGTTNGKPAPKPRLPEPPKTNGKAPSRDETREARIAAAKRVTEQQMRGMRV